MIRRPITVSVFEGRMLTIEGFAYDHERKGPIASLITTGQINIHDLTAEDFRHLAEVATKAAMTLEGGVQDDALVESAS